MTHETAQTREALVEVMAALFAHYKPSELVTPQFLARKALLALEAAGVRLVPSEATLEMMFAGEERMGAADVALILRRKSGQADASETVLDTLYAGEIYTAMLSASPYAKDPQHEPGTH